MKTILFILMLASSFAASAEKIVAIKNDGDWAAPLTWDLNRVPITGDTINIPNNIQVRVKSDVVLGNVLVNIWGELRLHKDDITVQFGPLSKIYIHSGGELTGKKDNQLVKIGLLPIFNSGLIEEINGPAYAAASTGNGFGPFPNPLPVRFVSFNAMRTNSDVLVQWSTSEEVTASHFDIERSFDGNNFKVIGSVTAKGNSSSLVNYSFTDKTNSSSVSYYRIRQVDLNGAYTYTSIKPVRANDTQAGIDIRGNNGRIVMNFSTKATNVSVRVISLSGQVISETRIANAMGQVIMNAPVKGHYIVSVSNGSNLNASAQVIF